MLRHIQSQAGSLIQGRHLLFSFRETAGTCASELPGKLPTTAKVNQILGCNRTFYFPSFPKEVWNQEAFAVFISVDHQKGSERVNTLGSAAITLCTLGLAGARKGSGLEPALNWILKFNIAQHQQQVYRWIFSLTTKLRSWSQKYVIPSIKRDTCTLCEIPVFTGFLCSMGLHKPFLVLLRILLHCVHSTVGLKVVQNYCVWFLFSPPDLKIYINCTLVHQKNARKWLVLLLRWIINYLHFSLRKEFLSIVSLLVLEFFPLKWSKAQYLFRLVMQ